MPRLGIGQVRIAHGYAPVTRQQAPLDLALGVERKQRLQALAQASAVPLRLVEPSARPLRDDFKGELQQVVLVGEVVREDGGARSRGFSHVPEGQRLQTARSDEFGGGGGEVSAPSVVVNVSRH